MWSGLKRAFGFGAGPDDDETEYDSSLPTYAVPIPQEAPVPHPVVLAPHTEEPESAPIAELNDDTADTAKTAAAETDEPPVPVDEALPGDLFDALIEQFNAAQPDFISRCLNTEAQREYLFKALDEKLRARIHAVLTPPAGHRETERDRLLGRIREMEAKVKSNESLRQENRKLRLSVERQKRSLLDRINDLETQLAANTAEKEKFFASRHYPASADENRSHDLQEKLQESETKQKEAEKGMQEAQARVAELTEALEQETRQRRQLEDKTAISDQMINELRNQAAAERKEYEETCRQQEEALEQIHARIEEFAAVKGKLEERIRKLKESLKAAKEAGLEERVSELQEENASLRHTIETNIYNQAANESRLNDEIRQLKLDLEQAQAALSARNTPVASAESAEASETAPEDDGNSDTTPPGSEMNGGETNGDVVSQPRRRRGRPRKARPDDELDNTDWFASAAKDDPDFGYHEPPRRPANNNEAQLSLF